MISDEEQEINYRNEQERREKEDFKLGNRRTPLTNNVLLLLGDLLQPQTTGFTHVNNDMSFTNLNDNDLYRTDNSSFLINWFNLWGLQKCAYTERGALATLLISKRSYQAKTMELFTSTVNVQKSEFKDITEKKTAFQKLFGKKEREEN